MARRRLSNIQRMEQFYNKMSERELRKEYTKMRDIAQKRLKRMSQSGFKDSLTYRQNAGRFPKLAELSNKSQIAAAAADLKTFINNKLSTITGLKNQQKKTLKSLEDAGYDFINKGNFQDFIDFMEWFRENTPQHYGSPDDEDMKTYLDDIKKGMTPDEAKKKFLDYLEQR